MTILKGVSVLGILLLLFDSILYFLLLLAEE